MKLHSLQHPDDTIAAIATAPGGALRGIVRISGPEAVSVTEKLFQPSDEPHDLEGTNARVVDGFLNVDGLSDRVPCRLYLWPTRRSYTQQPTVEFHLPGAPPILDAVVAATCAAGARPAEPGEFTLRAFLAGRLDLTQAEAVLGVIDAVDSRQLRTALDQLAGGVGGPLTKARDRLLQSLAHLEAGLDFVEEEDVTFITSEALASELAEASDILTDVAHRMEVRQRTGAEFHIVLLGRPNTGKSSLLNALAGDAAAIVTDIPGTTRDYVTRQVEIGGVQCLLADTAGVELTDADHSITSKAMAATEEQMSHAQLQLFCIDASRKMDAWEREQLDIEPNCQRLIVLTKCDLPEYFGSAVSTLRTSSTTGQGLDHLRNAIAEIVETDNRVETDVVGTTAIRCRDGVRCAVAHLEHARAGVQMDIGEELIALDLRAALDELGRVVGAVYTEDILDRIFSRFCVGK